MIFYEKETLTGLLIASLPAIFSVYFFYIKDRKNLALFLLLMSAFFLRILMITVDPYLHDWDERYHALVAKNMIEYPFKPMLFAHPVFHYLVADWSYNHIWVHKQPVFLWQMAIAMKIFGINTVALRLPSAIMGTIFVWLVYDISRKWIRNDHVSFLAAFLAAFAYYFLELISGSFSLDHNDVAFIFYLTCSFWAFTRYVSSGFTLKWAIIIGLCAGLAILNKWLTGFMIMGGWGIYLLISQYRFELKKYIHLILSLITACVIFLPWQFYILHRFPVESSIAYEYNIKHMTEDMGHPGNALYHLTFLPFAYHAVLLAFFAIGSVSIFYIKTIDRKMTISFMAMIVAIFSFFTLFVPVKMPSYVYPVSGLILILMACGIHSFFNWIFGYFKIPSRRQNIMLCLVVLLSSFFSLKPYLIMQERSVSNKNRNVKIHNTTILKNQDDQIMKKYIVLNCKAYENIELMFYENTTAYHFWPSENVLDSMQALGYKFVAFQFPLQLLPDFITSDQEIKIIQEKDPFK